MVKIVAVAGSVRDGSYNRMLLNVGAAGCRQAGAEVIVVDLREYEMPFYDAGYEKTNGLPEAAVRLQAIFGQAAGVLIASPEYNGAYSALLKNTIDWVSRPSPTTKSLAAFAGKAAAVISASPGALGGFRGLAQLRGLLQVLNMIVLPEQLAVGNASQAFTGDGQLVDPKQAESLNKITSRLVSVAGKLL